MRDCETCKHYVKVGNSYGGEVIKCCEYWECNYERGMTESEAKGFVQGKLDCMEKCDVFNREDKHRNNECDNCEYCYTQGTFGEQTKAFSIAIKALEKQIPKKPIINYMITSEDATEIEYTCSVCGTNFVELTPCKEWCPYCGNKIDWSDEE